jgi:hypothetical protein
MAYYVVLSFLFESINHKMLGLHKVRAMCGTQNLRITQEYNSKPWIFRRETFLLDQIYLYTSVLYCI